MFFFFFFFLIVRAIEIKNNAIFLDFRLRFTSNLCKNIKYLNLIISLRYKNFCKFRTREKRTINENTITSKFCNFTTKIMKILSIRLLKFLLDRKIEKYLWYIWNFRCFRRLGQRCSRYKIRLHVGTSRSRNIRILASSIANRAHCSWNLGRDKNDRSFSNLLRSANSTDLWFTENWNKFHRFSCL